MFGGILQGSQPVLNFCLQGVFKITDSISFLVISLFKLFLLISVLAACMFLETCPFLLGSPICWLTYLHSILFSLSLSFFFFVFLWYQLLLLLFHVLFCLFGSSLFFFMRLARGLSILSFKKSAFGYIDLFNYFLISILFISSLIPVISFLLLTWSYLCSSFSNYFK